MTVLELAERLLEEIHKGRGNLEIWIPSDYCSASAPLRDLDFQDKDDYPYRKEDRIEMTDY